MPSRPMSTRSGRRHRMPWRCTPITLIAGNILQACAKPDDLQARGAMQVGSFLGGRRFFPLHGGHGARHRPCPRRGLSHPPWAGQRAGSAGGHGLQPRGQVDRYADIALAMGISFPQVVGQSRSLLRSSRLDVFSKLASLSAVDSLKELVTTSSHQARHKLATAIGNFGFIDTWVRGRPPWRPWRRSAASISSWPI
jgi:hypothetical protein